ncbi:MAG: hypothetical protein JNM66_04165 [Bryobacterales bacterium]|nr:hypothetical protein [Bryobacterales bacterium]
MTKRRLQMGLRVSGRRVQGSVYAFRFRVTATGLEKPVRYLWACLGEEYRGGAAAQFRLDLEAHPAFPVTVEATDAAGVEAPMIRTEFRMTGTVFGESVELLGVAVPR